MKVVLIVLREAFFLDICRWKFTEQAMLFCEFPPKSRNKQLFPSFKTKRTTFILQNDQTPLLVML